jgi:hypothetical protein
MSSKAGRNWTRQVRRSAPARLANAALSPASAAAAGEGPRERHGASTQMHRRNLDLSELESATDEQGRRIRKRARAKVFVESEEESESGTPISPSSKFSRVATGDWDVDDGDSDSSYNSFNLSMQKKALFQPSDPTQELNTPSALQLAQSALSGPGKALELDRTVTVYRVYRSHYEGELFQDGNLSAQLITGTNRRLLEREVSNPLFRWVHIENRTMNFNLFQTTALECPWLLPQEKDSLANILKVARQKSDRSLRLPQGKKGNYVEPEYYEETIQQTIYHGFRSRQQKTEFVRWMCIPYFVVGEEPVKKLSKQNTGFTPGSLPDFEEVSKFLDSGYTMQGRYFQVAQLWCLMLGDGKNRIAWILPSNGI